MDPKSETRATVMLDDGHVVEATRAGSWRTCHAELPDMAGASEGTELTRYLPRSRPKITRQSGGERYKSASELEQLRKDGVFQERLRCSDTEL